MKQRLLPYSRWTTQYHWEEKNTDHLKGSGELLGTSISDSNKSCVLRYENINVRCSAVEGGIIRIQVYSGDNPINIWSDFPKIGIVNNEANETIRIEPTNKTITISTNLMTVAFNTTTLSFEAFDNTGKSLLKCSDAQVTPSKYGLESVFRFDQTKEDHYYGFGGRIDYPDRKGRTYDSYSIKVCKERGDYGGFIMPFYLNPKGYSFILNNPYEHVYFDMGYEDPDSWFFYTPDGPIDIYILAGPNYPDMLGRYYQLTGKPVLPPKWMFGFWISWYGQFNAQDWVDWMRRFHEEGWPSDVAEIDMHWRGGSERGEIEGRMGKNLEWDFEKFGDGPKMIKEIQAIGSHVCLHVNTNMFVGDVREEGLAKGFFRYGDDIQEQVVPTLTSPESVEWNWDMYKPIVEDGVEVWWTDNTERVDEQITDELPSRNVYGDIWNRFIFDKMEEMGRKKRLVLSRGGWFGAHNHTLPWPGDTQGGIDRTQEDFEFAMNIGMSGVPHSTVDLGGFADLIKTSPDVSHRDENAIRRTIHGFLMFPVPRIHNTNSRPKFPWNYTEKVQVLYRYYLELRYRLFPYYYSASVNAVKNNVPTMRPLLFDYRDDKTVNIFDEFLIGKSLLIAPMMVDGRSDRMVYLPEGKWVHYWSKEVYKGGREYIIDALLHEKDGLPMFVKLNSIIPYCPKMIHVPEKDFDDITLEIYAESESSSIEYDLWEDENRCTHITYKDGKVTIDNQANVNRTYKVVFPLCDEIEEQTINMLSANT